MAPLLRLIIPTLGPIPGFGNREIVGGCVAFSLESILRRMAGRRGRLAEHYCLPPDPAALSAAPWGSREQCRLQDHLNHHREYLALAEAVPPVEAALGRGEDLDVAARLVLFPDASSQIEKHCRPAILSREFEWAECRACGRRYTPQECGWSDWSQVADLRAGVGGRWLACPAAHVIFTIKTWVA
jgi:hypothetical protein